MGEDRSRKKGERERESSELASSSRRATRSELKFLKSAVSDSTWFWSSILCSQCWCFICKERFIYRLIDSFTASRWILHIMNNGTPWPEMTMNMLVTEFWGKCSVMTVLFKYRWNFYTPLELYWKNELLSCSSLKIFMQSFDDVMMIHDQSGVFLQKYCFCICKLATTHLLPV